MIDFGFDFTGRQVVVTGGTRGVGLAAAQAFAAAGAQVCVTGTKVLPSMYDADLRAFSFHQLQLTNSDAIDGFVEAIDHVDVLVNAAGARLSGHLDAHEREFVAHSARHGFVGPTRLANKLRHRISSSQFRGGGAVIHTPASRQWLELTHPPAEAAAELTAQTRRAGVTWGRLGARVNTVLESPTSSVPAPQRQTAGALLTRSRGPVRVAARDVASIVLFLASSGATAITGQTVHVGL
ncbi:putative Short-chain dehydrogenase/reductase SDR [metagenome]|uniref:Putative Short-chain dehydrogenase/reductase SDR n=1 Tax=metagenome TaxID=256318 RepID=A0A2P2C236_9ZZZZ